MNDDETSDEYVAQLSPTGWFLVECIERMLDHKFEIEDILLALDLPSQAHMNYMLARAAGERFALESDVRKMMGEES